MRVRVSRTDLSRPKADLAACFAYEGDRRPRGVTDRELGNELAAQMKIEGFKGQSGDRLIWNANGRYGSRRFMVLGLGPKSPDCSAAIRLGSARAAREAAKFSAPVLLIGMPDESDGRAAVDARAAVEGAFLGAYRFDRYLTDDKRKLTRVRSLQLAVGSANARLKRAVEMAEIGARSVCLARDLVNEAPSRMTPSAMARVATREAKSAGLQCKVLGLPELRKIGMPALLAVARGSAESPRVVQMTYRPSGKAAGRQKIVLVGKGVTFDSGGLNLKPGNSMFTMKSDMAGSAAVLATMTALKRIGCKHEVHGFLGLTENMTGAGAYKPGDILDTYAGKTVEVGNTDAEGRLVLCDVLAYAAAKLKPTKIVDVATLTGACVVALGEMASGLFTRHDEMRDSLLEAGRRAGEKLWPLPMYEEYLTLLQKGPADLCNIGGRWGGAITAALFLGEFVPRSIPWAHLDIAGPAFSEIETPETPAGATGAAVSTLIRWLE